MTHIEKKIEQVKSKLKPLKKVAIGFSGGKDSFFLLKLAVETLGKENVAAFFVKTGFSTGNDEKRVTYFSRLLDFNLHRVTIDVSGDALVMSNCRERCYHCKTKIFSTLKSEAEKLAIETLLDGSTHSDLDEYRPGMKALRELGVVSLMEAAEISSSEIIAYLRENGVEDYYLTSSTCLATRFPYDFQLHKDTLKVFDELETYFVEQGIYPIKVRYIPDGIRIETPDAMVPKLMELKPGLIAFCKERKIKFVTLDLEGLRSGVWDD
ncbi:MAG: hypothetical protein GY765_06455 [bacterium]|nr:hypothetical protein [bacterium]